MVNAFNRGSLSADVAHAVEEQGLDFVVLSLFRMGQQRAVDQRESGAQPFGQSVHDAFATILRQFAEAGLDPAFGDGSDWLFCTGGGNGTAHGGWSFLNLSTTCPSEVDTVRQSNSTLEGFVPSGG